MNKIDRMEILRKLLERPSDGQLFFQLGEALYSELTHGGQRDEKALLAAVCYRVAAWLLDDARTWGTVGARLAQLRLSPLVQVDCFTRSLEKDPHNRKSLLGRGLAYKALRDYDKARQDLEEAIQLGDNDHRTYLSLAECYHNLRDPQKAREYLGRAATLALQQRGDDGVNQVRQRAQALGYRDVAPVAAAGTDRRAEVLARVDELAREGLPGDLAAALREKIRTCSVEEGERLVTDISRYLDMWRSGALTQEEFRRLASQVVV